MCSYLQTFDSITVSFVEMTNIDDVMAKSALEAVSYMNVIFSALDKIIDQHNVYKVSLQLEKTNLAVIVISLHM